MKSAWIVAASAAVLALAGCSDAGDDAIDTNMTVETEPTGNETAAASGARAELRTADGTTVGTATATGAGDALQVVVAGMAMPPGERGVHIHMTGACDAPSFETAGGHWNPTEAKHGRDNPAGPHKGDLPNLTVGEDGSAALTFSVAGAAISGGTNALLDADGAALVVHEGPDDYRTDPSGDSGGRIACGVFQPA